jgi:hypothetical protein
LPKVKAVMNFKINSIVITSILAFTLIAAGIPTAFVNVLAQQDGENATQGQTGGKNDWINPRSN